MSVIIQQLGKAVLTHAYPDRLADRSYAKLMGVMLFSHVMVHAMQMSLTCRVKISRLQPVHIRAICVMALLPMGCVRIHAKLAMTRDRLHAKVMEHIM
jgi:hypothetical protein